MTLEFQGVAKEIDGAVHLYPVDLRFETGRFNILLGATLAGKTTLIELAAGLAKPSAGSLCFNGVDVTGMSVRKRNVSVVYQQFINYPHLSVFENIASPLRVARMPRDVIHRRVGAMAEIMKISALLDRRPGQLSGGQQQRTAIARALIKESDVIMLDEPLANLDFKLREELREELPKILTQRDCHIIYATTEPLEALLLGGHCTALHEGRVASTGPTHRLYRHPIDLDTARIFSDPPLNTANIVKANGMIRLNEAVQWPADGHAAGLNDGPYILGLRPHHVIPVADRDDAVAIDGIVKIAELTGSESIIHIDAYGHDWVSLSHGIHRLDDGAAVRFYFDRAACFYFDRHGQAAMPPDHCATSS